jgi:LacI family transcriptional regulator
MRQIHAPTLKDVARAAGVTSMTASAVLHGGRSSTRVSEATRERVVEAASHLRYRPNAVARCLSRRLMDTIGVAAVIGTGEVNLYFLEVLNGILEAASEHRQNTTVFALRDWRADEEKVLEFCDGRVDGMILIAPQLSESLLSERPRQTPFVTLHANGPHTDIWNLDVDEEDAARAIVEHLIACGHRRIAHFTGTPGVLDALQRLNGYRAALEGAGIPVDPSLVLEGNYSFWWGQHLATVLLEERRPDPLPTAVFCASDASAYGCMEILARHGLRVPDDISVVGFDDTLTARMTNPPLTTVRQPFRQMGRRAVELLLPQVSSDPTHAPCVDAGTVPGLRTVPGSFAEFFPFELIIRGSVGPPPEDPISPPRCA